MASSSSIILLPLLITMMISTLFAAADDHHKTSTTTNYPTGFTSRLIHYDSPESPFYNPNLTGTDRVRAAVRRSLSRYNRYFRSNHIGENPKDMGSTVTDFDGNFEYAMNFYIGTPPTKTFAIADTASELIWLQCLPCELCYEQKQPIFDPTKSSSYAKIGCEDTLCKSLPTVRCNRDDGNSCHYGVAYAGLQSSEGTLSTETFVFEHDGRSGNISITELAFGCGHRNTDPFGGGHQQDNRAPGIVGLNRNALSLISQLSFDHFSHCFVIKKSSQSSLMHFGLDAVITEVTTPIVDRRNPAYYYLSMEGISIGNDRLDIPPGSFDVTPTGEGGFILDTGTAYTMINKTAHKVLIAEMGKRIINLPKGVDPLGSFSLCYECKLEDIQTTAPDVTFHFSGLNLVLSKVSTWEDVGKGTVCFAMLEAIDEISILGNYQLQNLNVGYDLKRKIVSFKYMDCKNT